MPELSSATVAAGLLLFVVGLLLPSPWSMLQDNSTSCPSPSPDSPTATPGLSRLARPHSPNPPAPARRTLSVSATEQELAGLGRFPLLICSTVGQAAHARYARAMQSYLPWTGKVYFMLNSHDRQAAALQQALEAAGVAVLQHGAITAVEGMKALWWQSHLGPAAVAGFRSLWLIDDDLMFDTHAFHFAQFIDLWAASGSLVAQPGVLPLVQGGRASGRQEVVLTDIWHGQDAVANSSCFIEVMCPMLDAELWRHFHRDLLGPFDSAVLAGSSWGPDLTWCHYARLWRPASRSCDIFTTTPIVHLDLRSTQNALVAPAKKAGKEAWLNTIANNATLRRLQAECLERDLSQDALTIDDLLPALLAGDQLRAQALSAQTPEQTAALLRPVLPAATPSAKYHDPPCPAAAAHSPSSKPRAQSYDRDHEWSLKIFNGTHTPENMKLRNRPTEELDESGETPAQAEFRAQAAAIYERSRKQTVEDTRRLTAKWKQRHILGPREDPWELLLRLALTIDRTDNALASVNQWVHVLQVYEAMLADRVTDRRLLFLGLYHDIGKLLSLAGEADEYVDCSTWVVAKGRPGAGMGSVVSSWNHDAIGALKLEPHLPRELTWVIRYHSLRPLHLGWLNWVLTDWEKEVALPLLRSLWEYDHLYKSIYHVPKVNLQLAEALVRSFLPNAIPF